MGQVGISSSIHETNNYILHFLAVWLFAHLITSVFRVLPNSSLNCIYLYIWLWMKHISQIFRDSSWVDSWLFRNKYENDLACFLSNLNPYFIYLYVWFWMRYLSKKFRDWTNQKMFLTVLSCFIPNPSINFICFNLSFWIIYPLRNLLAWF